MSSHRCEQCGSVAHFRCSGCTSAHYCSPSCQSDAWNVSHRMQCAMIGSGSELTNLRTDTGAMEAFDAFLLQKHDLLFPLRGAATVTPTSKSSVIEDRLKVLWKLLEPMQYRYESKRAFMKEKTSEIKNSRAFSISTTGELDAARQLWHLLTDKERKEFSNNYKSLERRTHKVPEINLTPERQQIRRAAIEEVMREAGTNETRSTFPDFWNFAVEGPTNQLFAIVNSPKVAPALRDQGMRMLFISEVREPLRAYWGTNSAPFAALLSMENHYRETVAAKAFVLVAQSLAGYMARSAIRSGFGESRRRKHIDFSLRFATFQLDISLGAAARQKHSRNGFHRNIIFKPQRGKTNETDDFDDEMREIWVRFPERVRSALSSLDAAIDDATSTPLIIQTALTTLIYEFLMNGFPETELCMYSALSDQMSRGTAPFGDFRVTYVALGMTTLTLERLPMPTKTHQTQKPIVVTTEPVDWLTTHDSAFSDPISITHQRPYRFSDEEDVVYYQQPISSSPPQQLIGGYSEAGAITDYARMVRDRRRFASDEIARRPNAKALIARRSNEWFKYFDAGYQYTALETESDPVFRDLVWKLLFISDIRDPLRDYWGANSAPYAKLLDAERKTDSEQAYRHVMKALAGYMARSAMRCGFGNDDTRSMVDYKVTLPLTASQNAAFSYAKTVVYPTIDLKTSIQFQRPQSAKELENELIEYLLSLLLRGNSDMTLTMRIAQDAQISHGQSPLVVPRVNFINIGLTTFAIRRQPIPMSEKAQRHSYVVIETVEPVDWFTAPLATFGDPLSLTGKRPFVFSDDDDENEGRK